MLGFDLLPRLKAIASQKLYRPGDDKPGEVATNRLEDQELSVLALHLLQISLVYVNTLMIQQVLNEPTWLSRMKLEDFRALTPLIYAHVNPYGIFELDMNTRLPIEVAA